LDKKQRVGKRQNGDIFRRSPEQRYDFSEEKRWSPEWRPKKQAILPNNENDLPNKAKIPSKQQTIFPDDCQHANRASAFEYVQNCLF
jgi:hypothetical protein